MDTRKCKSCKQELEQTSFAPSVWSLPLTRNIECRECVSIKNSNRARINKDFSGELYIICNEAWPEWCKIGLTTQSVEDRLTNFQTGSPFRDYYSYWTFSVSDVFKAEKNIHTFLEESGVEKSYEWFKISPEVAKEMMLTYLS